MKTIEERSSYGAVINQRIFPWIRFFSFQSVFASGRRQSFKPVKTLSVVIPCLNESGNIKSAFQSIRHEKGLAEIIIADGGSADDTEKLATELGVILVKSEKGRGIQVNAAVPECTGDAVLVLHADCRIIPGAIEQIIKVLNNNPHCPGGSLGMRFNANNLRYRILSILNNSRSLFGGISFGDQGQFVRREALNLIGGFPEQMLMEDVELSIRMKKTGRVAFIPGGIVASIRRWQEKGFGRNFIHVTTLFLSYLVKRRFLSGDPLKKNYYRRYYEKKNY